MKIQIISPAWPLRGGIASSSERLAQALGAAGHDVEIISFSLQYPSFLFPGKTQFTTDSAPEDVTILTKINAVNPLNWIKIGLFLRKKQPDLVIARFWMPFFGPALGTIFRFFSKNKTRRIALVDNIIPHEKRFGDRFLSNYFTEKCDGFIVMSQSVELEIKSFSKDNLVKYVPHPIYDNYGDILDKKIARKNLNLPENAPILLFFGFIRDYKGLDLLLKALGILNKRGHCPTLVIAGECYEDWNFYNTIISTQNLDNQVVTHLYFIENEKVASYFSAADLIVQPYKTATQSGISQLAFHFEKPMIVTRVGGLAEIVKNGVAGYVVEPNAAEIAAAIEDFFENNRLESLTEGVRREKARFSWQNLVDAVEDFARK
jgi:D-inositol-3-phosphate glycosyltransferase